MTDLSVAQIKGAVVYKFQEETIAKNTLSLLTEEILADKEFSECGDYDSLKVGFTPFAEGSFILKTSTFTAVQVTQQTKKPKASKVKALCKEKEAAYMSENELEDLDKETKTEIKRSVVEGLLPETYPDEPVTTVLWFTGDSVLVGTATFKKAEDVVGFLRLAIGTLPVVPLETVDDPVETLTKLVTDEYCETIALGEKVELIGEEGEVISFSKGSVYNQDTEQHIKDGAVVSKLQLEHDGAVTFTVNDVLEMSGIKVAKDILAGGKGFAELIITISEINKATIEVIRILGGTLGE